jgi:hypothetical protein
MAAPDKDGGADLDPGNVLFRLRALSRSKDRRGAASARSAVI